MNYKIVFLAFISYVQVTTFYAAERILSNAQMPGQSFEFSIRPHAFYIPGGRFFIGAQEVITGNNFALASAQRTNYIFKPLTPERVTLNNMPNQVNPLHAASIKHLSLLFNKLVIVKQEDGAFLYALDDTYEQMGIQVFQSPHIADANGDPASTILAITSTVPTILEIPEENSFPLAAFAAIANNNNEFNGDGSGIAIASFDKETNNSRTEFNWHTFDAQTGKKDENKAIPIGLDTPELFINNNLTFINSAVDMWFDSDLKLLYIALQTQAGSENFAGTRSILVAAIVCNQENNSANKIVFKPIAPASAFDTTDKIVGRMGSLARVAIHKIRTLTTRTHVRYLIVVSSSEDTKNTEGANKLDQNKVSQKVYALPLVDNLASTQHGTLANVTTDPMSIAIGNDENSRFLARVFMKPAQLPQELYSADDRAAQVGAGALLPGDITDIKVSGDAVFVSIAQSRNNLQPGIFYSQARFDNKGKIIGWTQWSPAVAHAGATLGFSYDPVIGIFWYLPTIDEKNAYNIFRTVWSSGASSLDKIVSREFENVPAGIQSLYDFPRKTLSFNQAIGSRLSFLALAGLNKLVLVQDSTDQNGLFGANALDPKANIFNSTNGSLVNFNVGTSVISISGGALSQVGPISSVAVAHDAQNGWLIVGGADGIAVLSNPDGSGWPKVPGLSSGFVGFQESMSFKLVGSYANVRKIVSIDNMLYILTSTRLYRVHLNTQNIAHNTLQATLLATAHTNNSFSDVVVSGPLALLATSNGLYRSGNGVDIAQVNDLAEVNWQHVILPESVGASGVNNPVTRFFTISESNNSIDVGLQGNIYVLNAYVGYKQAQIYRLFIDIRNNQIYNNQTYKVTDETVSLLPDYFMNNELAFFVNLGDYRNYVVTDGASLVVSRSAYLQERPFLDFLPPRLKSGQRFGARNSMRLFVTPLGARSIGQLTRSSASGAWIIPGDFGVRVLE